MGVNYFLHETGAWDKAFLETRELQRALWRDDTRILDFLGVDRGGGQPPAQSSVGVAVRRETPHSAEAQFAVAADGRSFGEENVSPFSAADSGVLLTGRSGMVAGAASSEEGQKEEQAELEVR